MPIKTQSATVRRAAAIAAYDAAALNPTAADWRSIADALRLALPVTKNKAHADSETGFAAWALYEIPATKKKLGRSPVMVFSFSDGETVRAPAVSLDGKPVNIGRALRVAFAYYRGRIAHRSRRSVTDSEFCESVAVPAIVSAHCETTGRDYDVADLNERTAALRAASAGPSAPGERVSYDDSDKCAAVDWLKPRFDITMAMSEATGSYFIATERGYRLAFAVMTFWPDLAETELYPSPVAPALKIPRHLLSTSRLCRASGTNPPPVAPSCAIRLAA